ncbi:MAG: hypothetical protein F4039_05570 [Gammaproteobacteria bacterium]|nr:hypothetical protein [Gammaproteobacteria bacterium]MYF53404.1 hypothetical protein [Gammaproteobacteria bacterium]MYK43536.1 hypothetical protein [Gammaproteobacteria bacterium]
MNKKSIGILALGLVVGAAISALVTIAIMNTNEGVLDLAESNTEVENSTTSIPENGLQNVDQHEEVNPSGDLVKSTSIDNLQEAWNALINDDVEDIGQLKELLKIAEMLMQEDWIKVLDQLVNSQMDDSVRDTILKFVVHNAELENPEVAFQQVMLLSSEVQELALPAIVKAWAEVDPAYAFDVISNLDSSRLRASLQETLFTAWAKYDPELALQTALNQPLYKSQFGFERGLEEIVIAEVAKYDLDKAIAMLPQIRSGDARLLKAYRSIGRELVSNGEYDRALTLGQDLSEDLNDKYLNDLLGTWAQQNPDTLFDALDTNIWTPKTKEKAAANLLLHNTLTASEFDLDQTEKLIGMLEDNKAVFVEFGDGEELLTSQVFRQGDNVIIPPVQRKSNKSLQEQMDAQFGDLLKNVLEMGGSVIVEEKRSE